MLSQKSLRRRSSPPPVSRGVGRARAAVADRRACATERARGRTSHGRAQSPDCSASRAQRSGPGIGLSRRPLEGSESFPPRKSLKTNETELESHKYSPVRRRPMQRRRPSRRTERGRDVLGRSREIAGAADAGRRNFPIRNPLKRFKMAKESGRPSLLAARAGVRGERRVRRQRFHPSGLAEGRRQPAMTDWELARL
jgi:hypothetical protein